MTELKSKIPDEVLQGKFEIEVSLPVGGGRGNPIADVLSGASNRNQKTKDSFER